MSQRYAIRCFTLFLFLACSWTAGTSLAACGDVVFDDSESGKIKILIDGQQAAVYVYEDPEISRPYFAHLRAPGGPQVSRNHPPLTGKDRADHPTFHPGLWMSFGDISGNDYWRLAAKVRPVDYKLAPDKHSFTVRNEYLSQEDPSQVVCRETCTYTIQTRPSGYLLLWDSKFASDQEFYFGDQEEMGIGFRVATPIRVESEAIGQMPSGNGRMIDSEGRINGEQIWGNVAEWCDYSGELDGQHVGMTLFCSPNNFRPSWFHARDYGLLEANPFGREAFGKGEKSKVPVKPGETMRLQYGVLIHASRPGTPPALGSEYANYIKSTAEK